MTRTFGGSYARPEDSVYHEHIDCPRGQDVEADPRALRGAAAIDGRELCEVCARMSPPERRPPRVFGGS